LTTCLKNISASRLALKLGWAALGLASSLPASANTPFDTPIGLGLVAARIESQEQYALALEGQNHFKQRRGRYGFRQYGHAETRAELGRQGIGLRLSATPGITWIGLPPAGGSLAAHVGFEPLGGRIALHSHDAAADYYEWLPTMSIGPQIGLPRGCRLLPHARAGGGVGNLGQAGWSPTLHAAYGAGAYLNCPRLDVAAELTRLEGGTRGGINLAVVDAAYEVRASGSIKIGVRAESELAERRALLLLRGEFKGAE
jgi:hypothetical protein